MQHFSASTLAVRTFPDRKPVWILLTALAFCVIGMVTVFGTTEKGITHSTRFSAAVDFLAPSGTLPQQLW